MSEEIDHNAEVRRRLTNIEHKNESMQHCLSWLVRANEVSLLDALLTKFGDGENRIAVYLALDGKRRGKDIATYLKMKQPNVSREIAWLLKKNLIRDDGDCYVKEDFDKVVELSPHLEKRLAEIRKKKQAGKPNNKKANNKK